MNMNMNIGCTMISTRFCRAEVNTGNCLRFDTVIINLTVVGYLGTLSSGEWKERL
jgi:hypothetical protein